MRRNSVFQRYSFVAVTTRDLARARRFWVEKFGFRVTRASRGHFFMLDAGGLRLCVDREDGEAHRNPGSDPVIGLKVSSLDRALEALTRRGLKPLRVARPRPGAGYAEFRDPDGRLVIVTQTD